MFKSPQRESTDGFEPRPTVRPQSTPVKGVPTSSAELSQSITHIGEARLAERTENHSGHGEVTEIEKNFADLCGEWNGYPDGSFTTSLTWEQFRVLNELKVDWAYSGYGRRNVKGEADDADDPQFGKRSFRGCLGILQCDNPHCELMVRPKVKSKLRREQEGQLCMCNEQDEDSGDLLTDYRLAIFPCPNIATLIKWKEGVKYRNGCAHNHPPFERKKRLSPIEQHRADLPIKANPTATASSLRSGNTVTG
ncbi:hypothetical protein PM082_019763 [Marasmius tenuissimus]|nr:hypothetical protein PM082_019763 [Marasmius tenuissimus]